MLVSLLSGRRQTTPAGASGGGDAAPGLQRSIGPGGAVEDLGGRWTREFIAGERLVIETPGGGGWGEPGGA
jgi:5-oxoprolinase (ATP-hydrolysing)